MFIAKVKGSIVTTQKIQKMTGKKLLIVEPMRVDEKSGAITATGRTFVAVDQLGAGLDEMVLITQGSSARMTDFTNDAPVDCVIIGIVDSVLAAGKEIFKKSK